MSVLMALTPPAAAGVVLGGVILWDRLREPHRDPAKPFAVVDARTFRDGRRRYDRLVAAGDWSHAHAVATAICVWLRHERHHGRAARRRRLDAQLGVWTARAQEAKPW
ncbi:hypothetical protein [Saccharothrix obliqua]|uniref:hypothetical protein n=1 Tax=Saccharothrix obliqua TaxID=2861747 RepID=UPI001C5E6440|nr:hypothetical protein [Saccharothrix obliqua]MBW4722403.1 hypothetical protein [Saccharothrix obliqua]